MLGIGDWDDITWLYVAPAIVTVAVGILGWPVPGLALGALGYALVKKLDRTPLLTKFTPCAYPGIYHDLVKTQLPGGFCTQLTLALYGAYGRIDSVERSLWDRKIRFGLSQIDVGNVMSPREKNFLQFDQPIDPLYNEFIADEFDVNVYVLSPDGKLETTHQKGKRLSIFVERTGDHVYTLLGRYNQYYVQVSFDPEDDLVPEIYS